MVAVKGELRRYHLEQLLLDGIHRVTWGEASAVADAEDMRIDGDGRPTEGGVKHHIGRFAPNAGQGFQGLTIFRDLAAMQIQQQAAGLDDIFGLAVIQADGLNMLFDTLNTEI